MAKLMPDVDDAGELISKERKQAIRLLAQEDLRKELVKKAEEDFRKQAMVEARQQAIPEEELRHIAIQLPRWADRITLDGVAYMHGMSYMLPKNKFDDVSSIIFQTWKHNDETSGKSEDEYRRPLSRAI